MLSLKNKEVAFTFLLLGPILFAAIFADLITTHSPLRTGIGPALLSPSSAFPMGTDQAGGDVYSQVVYGARVALYVAIGSTALALVIAILIGLPAGYMGGLAGEVLMRATDLILSIPSFILTIFIVILFGSRLDIIILVIGCVSWPTLARIARAQVLSFKEREFVLAARGLGAGSVNIMLDEILPNIWPALIPAVTIQMGLSVVFEAGLSFLGLGDPNVSSWGRTLWLASRSIYLGTWWSILLPGIAIVITILGFNIAGDTLEEILNPRER
jgi:peptide/nickel transport system permease protein